VGVAPNESAGLMPKATFSVVTMAREEAAVLLRFATHYLGIGAERVVIFFDGEAEEIDPGSVPGVTLIVCDRAYWQEHLGRQPTLEEGQHFVFRMAHEMNQSDWLLICDSDEFLCSDDPVADVLSTVPVDCNSLRVMNSEAVWGPGDRIDEPFGSSYFRFSLSARKERLLGLLLYGARRGFFRKGFVGHGEGKYFLRKGAAVDQLRCHFATVQGKPVGIWAHHAGHDVKRLFIAHFDAISEARWVEKLRRQGGADRPALHMGPRRSAQIRASSGALAQGQHSALFRALYSIGWFQTALLYLAGNLGRRRIFQDKAVPRSGLRPD
jgi:hypothetical protein